MNDSDFIDEDDEDDVPRVVSNILVVGPKLSEPELQRLEEEHLALSNLVTRGLIPPLVTFEEDAENDEGQPWA